MQNSNDELMLRTQNQPASVVATKKSNLPSIKEEVVKKSQEASFTCGTVPKPWGTNVVIAEKSRVLSRLSKNDGALSRHKQWLREMQEKREMKQRQKQEENRIKEGRKRDFMEKQAKRRAKARADTSDDMGTQKWKEDDSFNTNDSELATNGEKTHRPAWSLTETVDKKRQESMEKAEENELMAFVDDLDANIFYEDMELRVLMSQIKKRIRELEKERCIDERRLQAVINVCTDLNLF